MKGFTLQKIKNLIVNILFHPVNFINANLPKFSLMDVLKQFPLYAPSSSGNYLSKSKITKQTINNLPKFLENLGRESFGKTSQITEIDGFRSSEVSHKNEVALKTLLDYHGSDKANTHNYHILYSSILGDGNKIENIFEIGLGTFNSDVVSNMGSGGQPGASLRAFRDYCPNANIYGADIDSRILFSSERIRTFYLDQTRLDSFQNLLIDLPRNFDLVIDDGLHSPDANIASLNFGLKIIKKGGWVVIEDINIKAIDLWLFISGCFPDEYEPHLIRSRNALVFAVQHKR